MATQKIINSAPEVKKEGKIGVSHDMVVRIPNDRRDTSDQIEMRLKGYLSDLEAWFGDTSIPARDIIAFLYVFDKGLKAGDFGDLMYGAPFKIPSYVRTEWLLKKIEEENKK